MSQTEPAFHFVCTREQAEELINGQEKFWVENCGCRTGKGKCQRSRHDVCLLFTDQLEETMGTGRKPIDKAEALKLLTEAEKGPLVPRPFRNAKDKTKVDGVCFCCDDCCYYLNHEKPEPCDKGDLIEATDTEECLQCGSCSEVCYFGARKFDSDELSLDRDNCYGCGVCLDVCSSSCIQMVARA